MKISLHFNRSENPPPRWRGFLTSPIFWCIGNCIFYHIMKTRVVSPKISVLIFAVIVLGSGVTGIGYAQNQVQDAPILIPEFAGNPITRSVAEDALVASNIGEPVSAEHFDNALHRYQLRGEDAESFSIDSGTGQLKTEVDLDYETKNTYAVYVVVQRGILIQPGPDLPKELQYVDSDTILVTINITNVNDVVFKEGAEADRLMTENTEAAVNIGEPLTATDADGSTLTYSFSGSNIGADWFEIDGETGQLKTKVALDFEATPVYQFRVVASNGPDSVDISVRVNITNVNEAPEFANETQTRSILENAEAGENIGEPVVATDADIISGEKNRQVLLYLLELVTSATDVNPDIEGINSLSYSLDGTDAALFEIDSEMGQLKTKGALDYETQTSHEVVVIASDGSLTASITVSIDVIEVENDVTPVCDRTPEVRDVIVRAVPGVNDCADVTAAHLAEITYLNLSRDNITALKTGDFDGLTSLEQLPLWGNSLTTLSSDIFDGLTALTRLTLFDNALTTLPDDIFDELTALKTLSLSANPFTTLPDGIFDELTQLTEIYITGSKDDDFTLPDGIFDELPQLTQLFLWSNPFTTVPDGIFDELTQLTSLDLSKGELTTLPDNVFDGLTSLKTLNLSKSSKLTTLPDGVFDELTGLETLWLHSNALTTVPDDIFDELTKLTTLQLDNNALTTLPDDIFNELTGLEMLWLHNNALTTLPDAAFNGLTALADLRLYGNKLTTLSDDVFDGLTELDNISLSDNDLTTLPAGIFDGLAPVTLDLSNNDLTSLPDGVFSGLAGQIFYFDLSGNPGTLSVTVSLKKVGDGEFKATAPTGAPFNMALPISVVNGSINGETNNITIPVGKIESETFTVTRTTGTTDPVTVDIGILPSLPGLHFGYSLVKSGDLPIEVISTVNPAAPALDAAETPDETALLLNYPNPFNPETWIPYHLANAGDVAITIYDMRGTVVRRLELGHQLAGYYTSRSLRRIGMAEMIGVNVLPAVCISINWKQIIFPFYGRW